MRQALDIDRLTAELSSPDPLQRETAVARLALAGSRAVPRLLAIAGNADASIGARVAAFEALEASPETRGVVAAAVAVQRNPDDELALAAIGVLAHAAHGRGASAASALDCLTGVALDSSASAPRRLAALAALDGLPDRHVRAVYDALRADPASRVVARVIRHQAGLVLPLDELLERGLPDDPALVSAVVREDGDKASLGVLGRLIEAVRTRERRADAARRSEWMAVRGQVHQALASRGSRLALYDLRETLEKQGTPLPVGFLAAAAAVGDATCLDAVARAWLKAGAADRWWRDHLAEAFGAIVRRDGITRRHPKLRAMLQRFPGTGPLVALARKS